MQPQLLQTVFRGQKALAGPAGQGSALDHKRAQKGSEHSARHQRSGRARITQLSEEVAEYEALMVAASE